MTATAAVRGSKQDRVRIELDKLIAGMRPGEPLPAERELARSLGVARMTLRRVIDILIAEHRLIRRQGAGTFVSPPRVDQRLSATSFTSDMLSRGLTPGANTVFARQRPAGMMLGSVLGIPNESLVLHVRRVRTADGEPMAVEDLHVPSALVPGLKGSELQNTSFYTLLEQRYGHIIATGIQTIEPVLVSAEDADCLGVPIGSPAFMFERTSTLADGQIVEFVRSVYRGDLYRIIVDIFPNTPQAVGDP